MTEKDTECGKETAEDIMVDLKKKKSDKNLGFKLNKKYIF